MEALYLTSAVKVAIAAVICGALCVWAMVLSDESVARRWLFFAALACAVLLSLATYTAAYVLGQ